MKEMEVLYPVPIRFHWKVMVELNDGNVIYGTSDDDLVERWGRILGWLRTKPLSPCQTRYAVARYLKVFYNTKLDLNPSKVSNTEFLNAVANSGQVNLIRK